MKRPQSISVSLVPSSGHYQQTTSAWSRPMVGGGPPDCQESGGPQWRRLLGEEHPPSSNGLLHPPSSNVRHRRSGTRPQGLARKLKGSATLHNKDIYIFNRPGVAGAVL